ncbi:acyltransferase [Paraburkholderia sp. A3BS-1L]|uniref:acyltransferase family protein n=1 Tax=Paraburkholderia sp. A3BS-1L TaxID=3028375 RepID=UPI003DAA3578
MTSSNEKNVMTRLPELDALRGLAAMSVVIFHSKNNLYPNASWWSWGYLCVDLFFIISGVVLTITYENRILTRETGFARFLRARFARMAPMHWAVLLATAGCYFYILDFSVHARAIFPWDATLYGFVLSALFLQGVGLIQHHTWNAIAWSISAEMIVNVLWFSLLRSGKSSTRVIAGIVAVSTVVLFEGWGKSHEYRIDTYYDVIYSFLSTGILRCIIGFCIGILIARHLINGSKIRDLGLLVANILSVSVIGAMTVLICYHDDPAFSAIDYVAIIFILPSLVISCLARRSLIHRILQLRVLMWLGTRSYSLYILHGLVILMTPFVLYWFGITRISSPWLGVIDIGAALVLSEITYRTIEMPFRSLFRGDLGKRSWMHSSQGSQKNHETARL